MAKRFLSIWFRYLKTDWFTRRQKRLTSFPFVLAAPDHGRMLIKAVNPIAHMQGVYIGMVVADARVIIPSLEVFEDKPENSLQVLNALGEWCIRYTPVVSIDPPDGLMLDVTGCAHLWGGEKKYLFTIYERLNQVGYSTRLSIAGTIGTAWANARFGKDKPIIENGQETDALLLLPPASLRIDDYSVERLQKLGLRNIKDFIAIPRSSLRRRFGQAFIQRLNQALGTEEEIIQSIQPIQPYQERLASLEPIVTATGIEIALKQLLETICYRLQQEQKGLRVAVFTCYRVDNKIQLIEIGTNRATYNKLHLFKLFESKLSTIEPALGIELFTLKAVNIEDVTPIQEQLWENISGLNNIGLSELLDRLVSKIGNNHIHRFIPDEHYWPERSLKPATSLNEKFTAEWKLDRPRPVHLLAKPVPVEVTAPIPDYPPMLFRYKGKLHKIMKADGPERIEQEWWLQRGQHRDYYLVEDEEGNRYWLFRLGHYDNQKSYQWFIHGFFA
ncbi:MAG: Y-family DNA polymerase [Chitinophagaceae bacterium]